MPPNEPFPSSFMGAKKKSDGAHAKDWLASLNSENCSSYLGLITLSIKVGIAMTRLAENAVNTSNSAILCPLTLLDDLA